MAICVGLFMAGIILQSQDANAQNTLEVEGKAKVSVMDKYNTADSVVVRLSDGTLAIRDVATLSEYQILTISNDTVYLSNGKFVHLSDNDSNNEKINNLAIRGDSLIIMEGVLTLKVPMDSSNTNELQNISRTGLEVTLSNGGGTFQDSVNVYSAGSGIDITNNVISATQSNNIGNYGTVVNPVTGKVWLDRNLGATQVATSSTDTASYGDLYQWGRGADGHQLRTSLTTSSQAPNWLSGRVPWEGLFIIGFVDWLSTMEVNMWSGAAAENNPCPSGFRVPTNAEWEQERLTWSSNDAAGAFASPLRLPVAGFRDWGNGALINADIAGFYWSSTIIDMDSRGFAIYSSDAEQGSGYRAYGFCIRCIKD